MTVGLRTPALGARMAVGAPAVATAAAPIPAAGPVVAPMAIVAISPPMAMPVVTATYPIAAAPARADGRIAIAPGFDIALVDAAYELSGRPTPGCDAFDADDPVRRFTFSVSITNRTGADLASSSWGAAALTPRGRAMQMCHFSTAGPSLPDLPAGQARRVTLSAFVARNESVTAIVVEDGAGNAERLCVRGTRQVACAP